MPNMRFVFSAANAVTNQVVVVDKIFITTCVVTARPPLHVHESWPALKQAKNQINSAELCEVCSQSQTIDTAALKDS